MAVWLASKIDVRPSSSSQKESRRRSTTGVFLVIFDDDRNQRNNSVFIITLTDYQFKRRKVDDTMVNVDSGQQDTSMEVETPTEPLSDGTLQSPSLSTRVFKDECMYCFHTPFFKGGIYVCLHHFVGLCANHVAEYAETNGSRFFLRIQKFKVKREEAPGLGENKLMIKIDKEEIEEKNTVVVAPHFDSDIPVNEQSMDEQFFRMVQSVIRHTSATVQDQVNAGVSDWDGSERKVLPDAENWVQLETDKQIPYSGWVCEEPNCGLTENLWLNLTDGVIKCGRAQYIAEGKLTKGNSHAKFHAENSGFTLLVKLGTIENGDADVFNYADNESVRDPCLRQHLAHFGLDIDKFKKTEKSTFELELDMNQKWEWSRCQEDGVTLENVYGSGFSGLINIGSSCYINSVLQTLLLDPSFIDAYLQQFNTKLSPRTLAENHENFNFQLTKVIHSLVSGEYAKEGFEFNGIKPVQFRRIAGRGHPEFSTGRQQDAEEYIRYLFNKIEETLPVEQNPVDDFRFKVVKRFQDVASGKVRYEENEETILALPIPKNRLRDAEAPNDVELPQSIAVGPLPKPPRKTIDLDVLIEHYAAVQFISGFISPITQRPDGACQSFSLKTFPNFLLLQISRYEHDENFVPHKLDVDVNVPDELNLERLRSHGLQPGEELLPESVETPAAGAPRKPEGPQLNETYIRQLMDMGIDRRMAETAVFQTNNRSPDEATEWVFAHMEDPNIEQLHPDQESQRAERQTAGADSSRSELEAKVNELVGMLGITAHQARFALQRSNNDSNAAAEWYFMNMDNIPTVEQLKVEEERERQEREAQMEHDRNQQPPIKREKKFHDGPPTYQLRGFITHMGNSPHSGHYVAHLKRNGKWYLYNDEKVAVSQNPPKSLGYIYLYERVTS
ncbi:Ubiquitin carboxyl-terminal hydrolase [Aphelenchoides besseyi]|nr:Ubiquitin carboxyl-terminal hydrolase [Aphelenchoides besseyi]KAI6195434.1 Ubiquitin carboxyl-terminal hydrolase [Aphelenchoides besseyi]